MALLWCWTMGRRWSDLSLRLCKLAQQLDRKSGYPVRAEMLKTCMRPPCLPAREFMITRMLIQIYFLKKDYCLIHFLPGGSGRNPKRNCVYMHLAILLCCLDCVKPRKSLLTFAGFLRVMAQSKIFFLG